MHMSDQELQYFGKECHLLITKVMKSFSTCTLRNTEVLTGKDQTATNTTRLKYMNNGW